jgi:hypothetical protein
MDKHYSNTLNYINDMRNSSIHTVEDLFRYVGHALMLTVQVLAHV